MDDLEVPYFRNPPISIYIYIFQETPNIYIVYWVSLYNCWGSEPIAEHSALFAHILQLLLKRPGPVLIYLALFANILQILAHVSIYYINIIIYCNRYRATYHNRRNYSTKSTWTTDRMSLMNSNNNKFQNDRSSIDAAEMRPTPVNIQFYQFISLLYLWSSCCLFPTFLVDINPLKQCISMQHETHQRDARGVSCWNWAAA
jgi:hypothetical protein